MSKNPKVTLNVLIDFIRINQIKTTYTALASTLLFVAVAIIIYLQNLQGVLGAIVLAVFSLVNYLGSRRLKTDKNLILESEFDLNKADYEFFLHRCNSNRIVNIILSLFSLLLLITAVAVPLYLIFIRSYPYNYAGVFFAILSISVHMYLIARTNNEYYSLIKTKLDQLYG